MARRLRTTRKLSKLIFILLPLLLLVLAAQQARAISLTFANGVPGNATSYIANCNNPLYGQAYVGCTTRAFSSDDVATSNQNFMDLSSFGAGTGGLGEESFATAFANTLGAGWSLTQGPTALAGITLTVTSFGAGSYSNVGGIGSTNPNITVTVGGTLNNPGDPALGQLAWIQGLEIDYQPGLPGNSSYNTGTDYNVLDDATFNNLTAGCTAVPASLNATTPSNVPASPQNGKYCDPIYPFQYTSRMFYDAPLAPWPNGSFRGIAMLATIDTVSKTVNVYGGVTYGFDNPVAPEPGTWMLLLTRIGGL